MQQTYRGCEITIIREDSIMGIEHTYYEVYDLEQNVKVLYDFWETSPGDTKTVWDVYREMKEHVDNYRDKKEEFSEEELVEV